MIKSDQTSKNMIMFLDLISFVLIRFFLGDGKKEKTKKKKKSDQI